MQILKDFDLTKLNTFRIGTKTKFFVELKKEEEIKELLDLSEFKNNKKLFLGGGSNTLFTKDFDGMVILNKLKGIEVIEAPTKVGVPTRVGKDYVYIRAMGGEIWQDLVNFAVARGLWGIENLSFIPGTVGATPVQNIGAYGSEVKDIIENVETYQIETREKKNFNKQECEFGYRESVFKNKLKGQYFIISITIKLNKKSNIKIGYKALREYLDKNKIEVKNPKDISDAVIAIRKSKLPDPNEIGNAGSFFKNVYVDNKKLEEIKLKYADVPTFEENGKVKIPAGWFIEKCGWKGKKVGNAGVYEKQALILINYGGATGEEIKNLAEQIIDSVFAKFGVILTLEVNIV